MAKTRSRRRLSSVAGLDEIEALRPVEADKLLAEAQDQALSLGLP